MADTDWAIVVGITKYPELDSLDGSENDANDFYAWLVSPALVPQLVLLTAIAGGILACLYLTLSRFARASDAPASGAAFGTAKSRNSAART